MKPQELRHEVLLDELVAGINMVRADPSSLLPALRSRLCAFDENLYTEVGRTPVWTIEGRRALEEAIVFLGCQKPVLPLKAIVAKLSMAAADHCEDLCVAGLTSHCGSDGSTIDTRVSRYGFWTGSLGELLCFGEDTCEAILCKMVIDDGIPDRSNRRNLFHPEFSLCGLAFSSHFSRAWVCCVMLAEGFVDYEEEEEGEGEGEDTHTDVRSIHTTDVESLPA